MKFEVNRLAMLEAVKNVAKVVASNSPVDILRGILVESNDDTGEIYLTATNHGISIQQKLKCTVEESGTMLIEAKILLGMITKLEGEFVSLSAEKPTIIKVTAGRSKFLINCLSAKSYPRPMMPFPEESAIVTGICSLAKRTVFAVGSDDNKLVLQCVQVKLKNNALHAAASDGARMMLVKDSAEPTDEREFLLPGRALQMLASISDDSDVFEVSDIGNEIVFVRGDMIFTVRKLNTGSYIDTDALVKNLKPIYAAVVDVAKMREALNLISVTALAGGGREPVNMVLGKDEIILRCNSDYSNAHSVVPANVTKGTPAKGFFYDAPSLAKLFQIVSGKVKLVMDERGCLVAKTRNESYFQSPLKGSIKKKANPAKKESARAKGAEDMKETTETKEAA